MEIGSWTFSGFDIAVLVILGLSGLLAFMRGISRELISILALLIGLAGALFVFGHYRFNVQNVIKPGWFADGLLFIGVFGPLYLLASMIMSGWVKKIRGRTPGLLNRLLGLGFGLVRGGILASLFVLVVSKLARTEASVQWMNTAVTYPALRQIADTLENLPFVKAKELAEDIQEKGKDPDILPDFPQNPDENQEEPLR